MPLKRYFCSLLTTLSLTAAAQLSPLGARVYGTSDTDLPTPVHSTKTISDGTALLQVINFVKMAGITNFTGAVGSGTITFGADSTAFPATVSLLGSTGFRLDVTKTTGTESTILNGTKGVFLPVAGMRKPVSSDIAAPGILGFMRLLSPQYPLPTSILTDQGQVTLGGTLLHRITLDDPSPDGLGNPWKTVDLYLDSTGRLVQSASFVHLSPLDASLYMLELSYSNYRTVGLGTLPYTFTQRLNGQLQWTLTLTSFNPSTVPDPSLFLF